MEIYLLNSKVVAFKGLVQVRSRVAAESTTLEHAVKHSHVSIWHTKFHEIKKRV
jgi:hypothetical protein